MVKRGHIEKEHQIIGIKLYKETYGRNVYNSESTNLKMQRDLAKLKK